MAIFHYLFLLSIGLILVINSVSYAQARSSSINTTINLSALIPATEINNTLKSRILDGANRKLSYDINSGKFNSVYFNVRTESSEITFPGNYAFTEVFNNLSCSSLSKNESFRFDVKINDKTLSSGNLVMNGPNLWYRGDDRFYSDTVIEMLSPLISDNEKKWCSGNVVLIVHKAL